MPPTDRKYAKQNLLRALGHCDYIINYLHATGLAFFQKGEEIEKDTGNFPMEYYKIMEQIDVFIEGQQIVKDGIANLEQNF